MTTDSTVGVATPPAGTVPLGRRRLVRALAVGLGAGACASFPASKRGADPDLPTWLEASARRVRSIDAADGDFTDLEPIGAAVGGARIVQLGEPSHGAGSAFAAKVRLTKYLHQRLGFDVLIWESGLYDVSRAQASMRAGDDGITAARKGIFTLWTEASQVRPLFDHVKASQSTTRPVTMAGFDLQVTADGTLDSFAHDLRGFVAALQSPDLRERTAPLIEQAVAARRRLFSTNFESVGDLDALTAGVTGLLDALASDRAEYDQVHGALEIAFMARTIENMRLDAVLRFEARSSPTTTSRESRRDAANADTLRWLVEHRYRGRKVIVWAHNVHVMNAHYAAGFHMVHTRPQADGMKTTGVFVKDWFGDDAYTLGFTAFAGAEGLAVGGPVTAIAPAPEGSVEALLHAIGLPYAFVDLRATRGHAPLRAPTTLRIPKFEANTIANVDRVYDGLFFIDRMAPATRALG